MKSFVVAVAAMAIIAVGAHFVLQSLDMSSERVFQSHNVRQ